MPSTNFNPLSPHGERPIEKTDDMIQYEFQSTLPAWGETPRLVGLHHCGPFQSTLPAWGETEHGHTYGGAVHFNPLSPHGERLPAFAVVGFINGISIHSPRMGRDRLRHQGGTRYSDFNPLSPHGERQDRTGYIRSLRNFNPLSPHGERPGYRRSRRYPSHFNPLSPHGERLEEARAKVARCLFQSTLPAWGET